MSKFTSEAHKSISLILLRSFMYMEVGMATLDERKPHCSNDAEILQEEIIDRSTALQSAHDELIRLFFDDAVQYGRSEKEDGGAGFGLTWYDFFVSGTSFGRAEGMRMARKEFEISAVDADWLGYLAGHRLTKAYIESKRDKVAADLSK